MNSESGIERLLSVVARLRGDGGCPWDREQTLDSLRQYLVEECYELVDAIDGGDADQHLDELGDVLLQVVLQAEIRKEEKNFCFDDVAHHLSDKLVRRHPHVFGDVIADTPEEVVRNWVAIKSKEKNNTDAIINKGLLPSKIEKYSKKWLNDVNNWNQVCNGGMVLGALAIYESNSELAEEIIEE